MKRGLAATLRATCLVLALAWSACSSPTINRIEENRAVYESWPLETRQLVLDGRVEPGMTPAMVFMAWGEPTKRGTSELVAEEVWVYEEANLDGPVTERRVVVFRGGVVQFAGIQRL